MNSEDLIILKHPPFMHLPNKGPKPHDADTSSTSTLNSDHPSTSTKSATPTQNSTPGNQPQTTSSSSSQASASRHSTTSPSPKATRRSRREKRGGGTLEDAAQMTVFLQQSCPCSPHVLHVVRLLPSIILVVVTEVSTTSKSHVWLSLRPKKKRCFVLAL